MSILLPDFGLLFWMLVAFGIVFFVLAKFGFPAITSMIDERKRYIDESLENARKANEQLAGINAESEAMLRAAHDEQAKILREAVETRDKIIKEAREKADAEGRKMVEDAKNIIKQEREAALREIRNEVAELSLAIAEKVLRHNLQGSEAQNSYVDKMVDEAFAAKKD